MIRQPWVVGVMLGGGCALAGVVAGVVIATGIYFLPASVRDSSTGSSAAPTRAAQDILSNQTATTLPTGEPAPLSTEDIRTASAVQASLTPTAAAIDKTPGAANLAPTDRPATSAAGPSPFGSATPSSTVGLPTTTATSAQPTRTSTLPLPTRTHTPVPPTRTHTPVPPTSTPSNTPLPVSASPTSSPNGSTGDIRVFLVGYASSTDANYEHIHLVNCDSKTIDVANWKIKSVATGDVYTLPSYAALPGCSSQVRFTVNTHRAGNESNLQGIFTWDQPTTREEWPNQPGRVELYDSTGAKKVDCMYQPDPARSEVRCQ